MPQLRAKKKLVKKLSVWLVLRYNNITFFLCRVLKNSSYLVNKFWEIDTSNLKINMNFLFRLVLFGFFSFLSLYISIDIQLLTYFKLLFSFLTKIYIHKEWAFLQSFPTFMKFWCRKKKLHPQGEKLLSENKFNGVEDGDESLVLYIEAAIQLQI